MAKNFLLKSIFLSLALFFATSICAQSTFREVFSPIQMKKIAYQYEMVGDFYTASNYLQKYIDLKPKDTKALYRLGTYYERFKYYKKALDCYNMVYVQEQDKWPEALYHKGRMLKYLGDYEEAKRVFQKIKDRYLFKRKYSEMLFNTRQQLYGIDLALGLMEEPIDIFISPVGPNLNGPQSDASPHFNLDTALYFVSTSTQVQQNATDSAIGEDRQESVIIEAFKFKNQWQNKGTWKDFPHDFAQFGNLHSFSVNNAKTNLVASIGSIDSKGREAYLLYSSVKENGDWTPLVKMNINSGNSITPSFAYNEVAKTDILFFASDRKGSEGGYDLFYSIFDSSENKWESAESLGSKVNTKGNEISPLYHTNERILFFSSDLLPGLGGFDIFSSEGNLSKWSYPINVGFPVNTNVDEFGYTSTPAGSFGFLVSNRSGGNQLVHANCCNDVYEFKNDNIVEITLELDAFEILSEAMDANASEEAKALKNTDFLDNENENAELLEKVENAVDKALGFEYKKLNTIVSKLYLIDEESGDWFLLKTDTADANGKIEFNLNPDKKYQVVTEAPGKFKTASEVITYGQKESATIQKKVQLVEKTNASFRLKNIYYEFGSSDLTVEAQKYIYNTMLKFMRANPEVIVEITAHTDQIGSAEYNQLLSEKRAESVVSYIIEQGIDKSRLKAKGMGKTKPIAPEFFPDGTDNPDGRMLNRRTEFRVIGEVSE